MSTLGDRAFGYNDFDARLPGLDIRRLNVRDAPELLYLMVDAHESNILVESMQLAECPKLRSLKLRASRGDAQDSPCRLTARGMFLRLVESRLYGLSSDKESLFALNELPILRKAVREDVTVK